MKKSFIFIVLGVFSVSILFTPFENASASSLPSHEEIKEEVILSDSLIDKVDPYIKVENKEFKIINEEELRKVINEEEYNEIKKAIGKTNTQLLDFDKEDLIVKDKEIVSKFDLDMEANGDITYNAYKEGRDSFELHWWGYKIFLSKSTVHKVLNVGSSGGSAAIGAAIGNVPGAILGSVVGSILSEFVTPSAARAIWVRVVWPSLITGFGFQ